MMGSVKIVKPGFFSTIQDEGRFGFSEYGVPRSGAMDQKSFAYANSLLGNDKNSACIEWAFQAPFLQFSEPTIISLTGALVDAFLNDKKIKMYQQIQVQKEDILCIKFCKNKVYGYVGIKKGFLTPVTLKSRSYFKSITDDYMLRVNDEIPYQKNLVFKSQFSTISEPVFDKNLDTLQVYKGAEFDLLSSAQKATLLEGDFTISNSINRMAIQLEEKLHNTLPSIITSAVLPGTVQLTPSGKLIVLMRDCQTTGGYPRVLQLTEDAINTIAQKRMQEKCGFSLL